MLNKFKNSVKKQFLPSLLKVFGDFYVVKQDFVTLNDLKKYKIFPQASQKENDDTIAGTYKGLDVYLQECKLTHTKKSSITDFEGLIIKVKYPINNTFKRKTHRHKKINMPHLHHRPARKTKSQKQ